jgi:hypothetical protein
MIAARAIGTLSGVLDLSYVLVDSLRMPFRCRNMQEFDTCHKLYFIVF